MVLVIGRPEGQQIQQARRESEKRVKVGEKGMVVSVMKKAIPVTTQRRDRVVLCVCVLCVCAVCRVYLVRVMSVCFMCACERNRLFEKRRKSKIEIVGKKTGKKDW